MEVAVGDTTKPASYFSGHGLNPVQMRSRLVWVCLTEYD